MQICHWLNRGFTTVAFDTEFAGVQPSSLLPDDYSHVFETVSKYKLIQVGITLANSARSIGKTWQFNFEFNKDADRSCPDAIKLLTEAGTDW